MFAFSGRGRVPSHVWAPVLGAVVAVERIGASSVEWRHRFWHPGETRPSTECRVVTVLVAMSSYNFV